MFRGGFMTKRLCPDLCRIQPSKVDPRTETLKYL